MAAGAGALNIKLGGAANYHGATEQRPQLGCGDLPKASDIANAQQLQRHALWLWLATISLAAIFSLIF
jgi:adenosylcobinamide-phosphate synthase